MEIKLKIGRILNRFSKDIGLMDDQLPPTFFDVVSVWNFYIFFEWHGNVVAINATQL